MWSIYKVATALKNLAAQSPWSVQCGAANHNQSQTQSQAFRVTDCSETPSESGANLSSACKVFFYIKSCFENGKKKINIFLHWTDLCPNHKELHWSIKLSLHLGQNFPSTINASFISLIVTNYFKIINFLLEQVRLTQEQKKENQNKEKTITSTQEKFLKRYREGKEID